jgi:enterochelin esterase-like enzyme
MRGASFSQTFFCATVGCLLFTGDALSLWAETIVLKNGMRFEGQIGRITSMANPVLSPTGASSGNPTGVKPVILVDDGLRRIFVSSYQLSAIPGETVARPETFRVPQKVAESGFQVNIVGPAVKVQPFDEFGRRIYTMVGAKGNIDVVQGITEVTPNYIRVQGLLSSTTSYVWDMRIATSSLPREILSKVLRKAIDPNNAGDRQRIVLFYVQADRMQDARLELEELVKEFPDLASAKEQVDTLRQLGAQRLMREIQLRTTAGQHRMAYTMAAEFPVEGVADATVIGVRDLNVAYEEQRKVYETIRERLKAELEKIEDQKLKEKLRPFCQEIDTDLNVNTLERMADFNRLVDDTKLTPDQKVALAVSGWLLGSGSGTENSAVAASVGEVRNLVRAYMTVERKGERNAIMSQLKEKEGSSPAYLAKIAKSMKPPRSPELLQEPIPENGLFQLTCAGAGPVKEFKYQVQLPPEYDPYRKYPCIVTMHAAGSTAAHQIDWWAGPFSDKLNSRGGQATRHGYIVLAVEWTREHQREYEYSTREHAAVLLPLRDALQRFSIDTDRTFLTGHGIGGDAVWEIGIAHPDLWAGVIPITPKADKYVNLYSENARTLSWYFIRGERELPNENNLTQWDRYLSRANYNVTIAEYLGRGNDHFYDEIQNLFEWMKLHERNFFPREFKTQTIRSTDNFFWWVEIGDFPAAQNVPAYNWPPPKNTLTLQIESQILPNNSLRVKGFRSGRVFIAPEMLDFEKKVTLTIDGGRHAMPAPSAEVLLEDVRTRGDRQHPFWTVVEF